MFVDSLQPLLKLAPLKPRRGVLTFSFARGHDQVSHGVQRNVRTIFKEMIEPFVNVRFVETREKGDITFQLHDNANAYAYAVRGEHSVHLARSEDNRFSTNGFQRGIGSYGFATIVHEILHTMGLSHPGNYNGTHSYGEQGPFLPYNIDNNTNSIMTYNDAGSNAITPMPYDISALQKLYGARSLNSGKTTYQFTSVYSFSDGRRNWGDACVASKLSLWDKSGYDTLDFSRLRASASGYRLDAGAEGIFTTNDAYNDETYRAQDVTNQFTGTYRTSSFGTRLAQGTQIEEIVGSRSRDVIISGSRTRTVSGLGGHDEIYGSATHDTIWGDKGHDVIFGGRGNDQLIGGSGGLRETDRGGRD